MQLAANVKCSAVRLTRQVYNILGSSAKVEPNIFTPCFCVRLAIQDIKCSSAEQSRKSYWLNKNILKRKFSISSAIRKRIQGNLIVSFK